MTFSLLELPILIMLINSTMPLHHNCSASAAAAAAPPPAAPPAAAAAARRVPVDLIGAVEEPVSEVARVLHPGARGVAGATGGAAPDGEGLLQDGALLRRDCGALLVAAGAARGSAEAQAMADFISRKEAHYRAIVNQERPDNTNPVNWSQDASTANC